MTMRSSKRKLKAQADALEKTVNDRNDTERLLLLIVFVAIVFLGWDTYLYQGLSKERRNLQRDQRVAKTENATVLSRLEAVRKGKDIDPLKHLKEKRNSLRLKIVSVTKELELMTSDLVSEEQMRSVLVSVLEHSPRLEIKELTSLEGVTLSGVDENTELAQYAMSIYKHGMKLSFTGDYFSTLGFLEKLENIEHKLIWESIDYSVTDYPEARVTLTVRTISNTEGYVGV